MNKEDLVVYETAMAQYKGTCIINRSHTFKRNKVIGRVRNAENPMVLYSGYVCHRCVAEIPKEKPV